MLVQFEKVTDKEQEGAWIKALEETPQITEAIRLLEGNAGRIAVMKDGQKLFCDVRAIYYVESVDKRTFIYTKEGCYETKLRLYELEEELGPLFARCSKAMIVNLRKVRQLNSEMGGRLCATLLNGEDIVISRSYVKEIKRRLKLS